MHSRAMAVVVLAAGLAACGRKAEAPKGEVGVTVAAATAAAQLTSVTVEVTTAPGVPLQALALDTATGTFRGSFAVPVGTHTFRARAHAGAALVGEGTATVAIAAGAHALVAITLLDTTGPPPVPDHAPIITSLTVSNTSPAVGEPVSLSAAAVDLDGDAVTWSWTSGCPTLGSFTPPGPGDPPGSAVFTMSAPGSCTLTVTATARDLSDARAVQVAVLDTTPPQVVALTPPSDATAVPVGTLLVAGFSEPLDPATVSAATFTLSGPGGAVAGAVTLSASGTIATFAPLAPLLPSTRYTAALGVTPPNAIRDLAGNALPAPVSWSFTTAAPLDTEQPRLVAVVPPPDQASGPASTWIYTPRDTPITATFSEPMDPSTVNESTFQLITCTRQVVPALISYAGVTATLTPTVPLSGFCYRATLSSGARDLAGNALDLSGWTPIAHGVLGWEVLPTEPPARALRGPSIAAGGVHTLATIAPGVIYAWGTSRHGALGPGLAIDALQASPLRIDLLPTNPTSVFAGSSYSAALYSGILAVWGWGLPIGLVPADNPDLVGIGLFLGSDASAGAAHLLSLAPWGVGYLQGFTVWGSGDEADGRLGPALGHNRARVIAGLELDSFVGVAAGGAHSLALRFDGTVLAWGDNRHGQLGDGSTSSRAAPQPVAGLDRVAYISAGDGFSVAVRFDRTVWAWGRNADGQLGDGTTVDRRVPVRVATLPPAASVSAGARHVLALLQNGTVRAWGHNAGGKLGDGTTADRTLPVAVAGLADVAEVSAGEHHSAARRADRSIWTWGGNSLGQLGDGTTADSLVPLLVPLDTTPPVLLSTLPAADAVGVHPAMPVAATFSEPLDPARAQAFNLEGPGGSQVPGTVSIAGAVLTFTPAAPLAAETTYTATVGYNTLADLTGNLLSPNVTWSFTTGRPASWNPSTPLRQSFVAGVGPPQVGSLAGLDFLVVNDAGTLAGAGTTYPPIAGLSAPMVGQPVLVTGPSQLQGFAVYAEDAGGCPQGNRLRAIALAIGSGGEEIPRSDPFTLHQAAAGCYGGFSAGHLGDGIAFAVVVDGQIAAGTLPVGYDPGAAAWEVGVATSDALPADPACAGSSFLVAEGLFGYAQAHAPGSPQTRAVLGLSSRPDAGTPPTVCAATLDSSGAWSLVSPLWSAGSATPDLPEVTAALDGSGNAVVLASRAGATSAAFETTAGFRADAGGAWEVTALDSSGRAALASAAFDAGGNAVAVWQSGPAAGAAPVYAARRGAAGGWTAPVRLSSSSSDAGFPRVSVLAGGAALALFQSDPLGQPRVYAADYQGGIWSAPMLVQDSALEGRFAETVRCPTGSSFLGHLFAWEETDPASPSRLRIAAATRRE